MHNCTKIFTAEDYRRGKLLLPGVNANLKIIGITPITIMRERKPLDLPDRIGPVYKFSPAYKCESPLLLVHYFYLIHIYKITVRAITDGVMIWRTSDIGGYLFVETSGRDFVFPLHGNIEKFLHDS